MAWALSQRQPFIHNFGSYENQQFGFVADPLAILKEPAKIGEIPENRNLAGVLGCFFGVNTPDNHGAAILDKNFCLDMLGVNGHA